MTVTRKTPVKEAHAKKGKQPQKKIFILKDEILVKSLLNDPEISSRIGKTIEIHTKDQFMKKLNALNKETQIVVFHVHESSNTSVGEKPHREYKKTLREKGFHTVLGHPVESHHRREITISRLKDVILPGKEKVKRVA